MAEKANTKTQIFNLVILDKSGSMSPIRKATIEGLNETINGIRKAQEKFADKQEHYFSLMTFCACEQKMVYDQAPIAEVHDVTEKDYEPCCCTPLYDAIGISLKKLKQQIRGQKNYAVVVTIITDGYENASKEYTGKEVTHMISDLREEGWAFAYMGADHDVEAVAKSMNITNVRQFDHTDEGTMETMAFDSAKRMSFFAKCNCLADLDSVEDRQVAMKKLSDNLYEE